MVSCRQACHFLTFLQLPCHTWTSSLRCHRKNLCLRKVPSSLDHSLTRIFGLCRPESGCDPGPWVRGDLWTWRLTRRRRETCGQLRARSSRIAPSSCPRLSYRQVDRSWSFLRRVLRL